MNGAESLVRTLVDSGVEVCFSNPGTSEMHFVAALDRVGGMRAVLALFEGVVTGMADGYGRMAEKPAATLLHLGPGLANGLANLHNARRAATPIVNIVGNHATYHAQYDSPLVLGRRGLCAAGVRVGPHFEQRPFSSGGRRPRGAGCATIPRTDRNIDLAGGYGMGGSRSSRAALAQAGCRGSLLRGN